MLIKPANKLIAYITNNIGTQEYSCMPEVIILSF